MSVSNADDTEWGEIKTASGFSDCGSGSSAFSIKDAWYVGGVANELVSVQPMPEESGRIYWKNYFYGEGCIMNMEVSISKDKLLKTLKENRENHKAMYEEARAGYVEKAKEKIAERMKQLEDGEAVRLHFDVHPPEDKTKHYDKAIMMVEWNEQETIQLTGREFQTLIMDEWEWLDGWLLQNVNYSENTRMYAAKKGLI